MQFGSQFYYTVNETFFIMCMIKLTVYHKILTLIQMYQLEIIDRYIVADPTMLPGDLNYLTYAFKTVPALGGYN